MTVEELINVLKHYNDNDEVLFRNGSYRYEVKTITERDLYEDYEELDETRHPNSTLKKYIVIGE